MKNVLKITVLIAIISLQTQAQVKFGVKAGTNISNASQNMKDSEDEIKTKMRMGYHIGATIDYGFSDNLSIQSGLLFSSKGANEDIEDSFLKDTGFETMDNKSADGYWTYVVNYIEVPLNVTYKVNNFQVYAGPYVAVGVGGVEKWDYTFKYLGEVESDKDKLKMKPVFGKLKEGDDDDVYYRALDYGLNMGVGYQVGSVLINAGYSLGLSNALPDIEGEEDYTKDNKVSHRVITFSVSYFFGK